MSELPLTVAIGAYDHVRDLASGTVRAAGIDLNVLHLSVEETFFRFLHFREWDVSEFSFGKYISLRSQGDTSLTAIPVFPSRMFRHSSIYVRTDSDLRDPGQLAGKRVGVPEWAQTASIYSRGLLAHQYEVDLAGIRWVQAGVNQAGRKEKVRLALPPGIQCEAVAHRSLNEMLLGGELDAVMTAHPPADFELRRGGIRRLLSDAPAVERAYWEATGIYPIMHVVVIRTETFERNRWIAMELLKAFEIAKNRSLARASDGTVSHYPLPWVADHADDARHAFGDDFWPYGVDPNRKTLDAFLTYAHEQGVLHAPLAVDGLFADETLESFTV